MAEVYLWVSNYKELVADALTIHTLLNVNPCPFTGRVTENEIKIVLGQDWDIWPRSIQTSDPTP